MKKFAVILALVLCLIPSVVFADDEVPPAEDTEPVITLPVYDDSMLIPEDIALIDPPPMNQEDIPCGEPFSLCRDDEERELQKPPEMQWDEIEVIDEGDFVDAVSVDDDFANEATAHRMTPAAGHQTRRRIL